MEKRTDIWQKEGAMVYRLVESGYAHGEPAFQNEWMFRVQRHQCARDKLTPQANELKEVFMAEHLVTLLNTSDASDKAVELVSQAFNSAIDFAITQGLEAETFLRMWREGQWSEIKKEFPEYKIPE